MNDTQLGKTYNCGSPDEIKENAFEAMECSYADFREFSELDVSQLYEYKPEYATVSLSSVATPEEIEQWKNRFSSDEERIAQVKNYCQKRLDDVKSLNSRCPSLAAFSTIPILIGFLANLAYQKNDQFRSVFTSDNIDGVSFRTYVRRFLLSEAESEAENTVTSDVESKWGLDRVLYKHLRCGLVHGSTLLNNRDDAEREITLKISHSGAIVVDAPVSIDYNIRSRSAGAKVTIAITAEKLCEWIQTMIDKMFTEAKTDSALASSIVKVFTTETPVTQFGELN